MTKTFINKPIEKFPYISVNTQVQNLNELPAKMTNQKTHFRISKLFILNILHNHIVDYPTPKNFNYFYNFGVIAGIILVCFVSALGSTFGIVIFSFGFKIIFWSFLSLSVTSIDPFSKAASAIFSLL